MARKLPSLGEALVKEIETAWKQPQEDWARTRLLVVRLIAQHEMTVAQIMQVADVSRQTVFTYRDKVVAQGVAGLRKRDWSGARVPVVRGAVPLQPVRLWVLDEHRYGLLPVIRQVWSRRGVRVHAPYATRYKWGYLHEALEVDGEHSSQLLFTPAIDREIHALFLKQIVESDPQALHVVTPIKPVFTCPWPIHAFPLICACCPCRPIVRNSTRSNASAA